MKIFKLIGLIVFSLVFYMLSLGTLNTHGFCKNKMSFISNLYTNEDIVNKGIYYIINELESPIRERTCMLDELLCEKLKNKQKVFYKNINEFKELNPRCCDIKSLGVAEYPISIFKQLTGDEYGIVEINYFRFFNQEEGESIKDLRKVNIVFDTCGEIKKHIDLSDM